MFGCVLMRKTLVELRRRRIAERHLLKWQLNSDNISYRSQLFVFFFFWKFVFLFFIFELPSKARRCKQCQICIWICIKMKRRCCGDCLEEKRRRINQLVHKLPLFVSVKGVLQYLNLDIKKDTNILRQKSVICDTINQ